VQKAEAREKFSLYEIARGTYSKRLEKSMGLLLKAAIKSESGQSRNSSKQFLNRGCHTHLHR